jgi:alpha-galactosidase
MSAMAPRNPRPYVRGTHGSQSVRVEINEREAEVHWSVTADADCALDAVGFVWDAGRVGNNPRLLGQGYQSWAPTRVMQLGRDVDSSRAPNAIPLVHAAFHADPSVADADELRSEQVAILALEGRPYLCVGFTGGANHAGTVRARIVDDHVELRAEAWLGGALLRAGERRMLHSVAFDEGDDPAQLLEAWAARVGKEENARVEAPFNVGWCSWYQYFEHVTEGDVRSNLARAGDYPFDIFQLDDGFQHEIGDWLATNEDFPAGVDGVAAAIRNAGYTPGIWIAPFLAAPASDLTRAHPEWLAGSRDGNGFAIGMYNEPWGGVMAMLDTTQPEVLEHLEETAAALVDAGYRYLKLDFTFAAAMPGKFADPTRTPAERVRAGFDAIRRGAGDETFILGCGAPIGAVVGSVDAMRIGADVAPWWDPPAGQGEQLPGYEATGPSTHNAFVNTCTRSFMHRRLWLNDPDCVMLRTSDTALSRADAERWAHTVGASGGLVLVSDDLALLGAEQRQLLNEVIDAGRASDAAARAGHTARCEGLLDPNGPYGISG